MKKTFLLFSLSIIVGYTNNIFGYQENTKNNCLKIDHQILEVNRAVIVPKIDGNMNDPIWKKVMWYGFDQNWYGSHYTFNDFFGRYKMTWTPEALYILVEIKDDVLSTQNKGPLQFWHKDDSIKIFLDANNSGGDHQFSNNAFIYNIDLLGNVTTMDNNLKPVFFNNHIYSKRSTNRDVTIWEFEIIIYDETFNEGNVNDPKLLEKEQKIGFAIAYNDNDKSNQRENFIGSVFVSGKEKELKLLNADTFGTLILKE